MPSARCQSLLPSLCPGHLRGREPTAAASGGSTIKTGSSISARRRLFGCSGTCARKALRAKGSRAAALALGNAVIIVDIVARTGAVRRPCGAVPSAGGPLRRALLATCCWTTTLLDAVADDATIIGAARRAGVIARAGDHRAVGTLDLDRAACEEHWLGSAGRQGATTGWSKYRGECAFGFSLGLIGEAGSSEEHETTAGEDEKGVRSHGSLLYERSVQVPGGDRAGRIDQLP